MKQPETPQYKIYHPYKKVTLKNTFNISQIITILFYEFAPSFRTDGESHDFWEFVYVDRGEIIVRADGKSSKLRQGEIVFHKPGEFHAHECDGTHSASVFILTFDCHSAAMKYFRGRTAKVPSELASLMKQLTQECTANFKVGRYPLIERIGAPLGGQQLVRIYLEEFLIRMMRHEQTKKQDGAVTAARHSLDNTLAAEISQYLQNHVCERVTLDELSEYFHFGKSHLCDIFKKAQGDTIVQYHLKLKITEAKRLLREDKLTVSEVSERLGFESPAYFSRIFGKIVGMSPRAFRSQLINTATVFLEKGKPFEE